MQSIVNDVFYSIYQYLGFGIVFAVICIFALPEIEKKGIKKIIIYSWYMLKKEKMYW